MLDDLGSWAITLGWAFLFFWVIRRAIRWLHPDATTDDEIAVTQAEYDSAVRQGDIARADQLEALLRDQRASGGSGLQE